MIDEVRLDPHQAFPHYQFFSFLFPFYSYLLFPPTNLHSSSRLASPSCCLCSFSQLDAQVWASVLTSELLREKQLWCQPQMKYLHMYVYETVDGGHALSALPLEIFVWRFHFSPSCFQLAGLNMPCKPGNDWHPERQDISWWSGRHVQFLSDTKHRLLLELNQIDMQSVCIYCTILIPLKFQNSLRSNDSSGGSNDNLLHTLW
jgi:hypothetical protein